MEITDIESFTADAETAEWYLGQVIQSLVDADDSYTASLLLDCRMNWEIAEWFNEVKSVKALLHTAHGTRGRLKEPLPTPPTTGSRFPSIPETRLDVVKQILNDLLPDYINVFALETKLATAALPANWRAELLEVIRREGTTNQGLQVGQENSRILTYKFLRFRSQSEIKIAQALDRFRVMYLPNCSARVNLGDDRVKREPDFLICHEGRWGVLEVDGGPFHPPSRTVHDHERDRLFKAHGIVHVEHYDATRCYQEPDNVVGEFLALLGNHS